jgi:hypothetical protein
MHEIKHDCFRIMARREARSRTRMVQRHPKDDW